MKKQQIKIDLSKLADCQREQYQMISKYCSATAQRYYIYCTQPRSVFSQYLRKEFVQSKKQLQSRILKALSQEEWMSAHQVKAVTRTNYAVDLIEDILNNVGENNDEETISLKEILKEYLSEEKD